MNILDGVLARLRAIAVPPGDQHQIIVATPGEYRQRVIGDPLYQDELWRAIGRVSFESDPPAQPEVIAVAIVPEAGTLRDESGVRELLGPAFQTPVTVLSAHDEILGYLPGSDAAAMRPHFRTATMETTALVRGGFEINADLGLGIIYDYGLPYDGLLDPRGLEEATADQLLANRLALHPGLGIVSGRPSLYFPETVEMTALVRKLVDDGVLVPHVGFAGVAIAVRTGDDCDTER